MIACIALYLHGGFAGHSSRIELTSLSAYSSEGHTIDEAVANLKEATELYLEEFPLPETTHPIITTFEAKCAA